MMKNVSFPESHLTNIIVFWPSACQKKPVELFLAKFEQKLRL